MDLLKTGEGAQLFDGRWNNLGRRVINAAAAHIVHGADVPNRLWLRPVTPCADQMEFGEALPLMDAPAAERLALEPRLRSRT